MSDLSFTIVGRITGANRIKTTIRAGAHNRTITTASGRRDLGRVYQIAWAAAQEAKWSMPEACAVSITAYNSLVDCDATPKIVLDAMIGVVYPDDRIVTELRVEKKRDLGGERYDVRVEPRAVIAKPKPLRRLRFEDLNAVQIAVLAKLHGVNDHSIAMIQLKYERDFTIRAEGCVPMVAGEAPIAWRKRAATMVKAA